VHSYETTFIINPQTDDATIEKHVNDIASIITENNGNILHKDFMGTRRLAYEIKNLTHGYYTSFIFEGDPSILPKLDRHFKLNEGYIRTLTVRFEGTLEDLKKDELFDFNKDDDSKVENKTQKTSAISKPDKAVPAGNDSDDENSDDENTDETAISKTIGDEANAEATEDSTLEEPKSSESTEKTNEEEL